MHDAQRRAIRIWTGIPQEWLPYLESTEDEKILPNGTHHNYNLHRLAPFFKDNANTIEEQSVWGSVLLPRGVQIDEQRHNAMQVWLMRAAVAILKGHIEYDPDDISKLKRHSAGHNCQVMLYKEIQSLRNDVLNGNLKDSSTEWIDFLQNNATIFSNKFIRDWIADIKDKWPMLKEARTSDEIIKEMDEFGIDHKADERVEQYEKGKWRFTSEFPEGLKLEFKKSVFSPDLSKIKDILDDNKKAKAKVYHERQLHERIVGSACAFLNTYGGDIFIGVDDDTGSMVGILDDIKYLGMNTEFFKSQDVYKDKVWKLLENNIINLKKEYIGDLAFRNYGKDYNGDRIYVLQIPCIKIEPSDLNGPVFLKKEYDKHKNKTEEEVLLKRVQNHNEEVKTSEQIGFYMDRFPEYLKHGGRTG